MMGMREFTFKNEKRSIVLSKELYLFELTAADFCLGLLPDVNKKDKHNPPLFFLHLPNTEAKCR